MQIISITFLWVQMNPHDNLIRSYRLIHFVIHAKVDHACKRSSWLEQFCPFDANWNSQQFVWVLVKLNKFILNENAPVVVYLLNWIVKIAPITTISEGHDLLCMSYKWIRNIEICYHVVQKNNGALHFFWEPGGWFVWKIT